VAGLLLGLGLAACRSTPLAPLQGADLRDPEPGDGGPPPPDLRSPDLRPSPIDLSPAPDLTPPADLAPAVSTRFGPAGSWTVPVGGALGVGFNQPYSTYWTFVDLNGDGKADLVETADRAT